jgi:hypothetical protein
MIILTSYLNPFAAYDAISGRVLLFFVVHICYSFCLSPYTPPIAAPQHTHNVIVDVFVDLSTGRGQNTQRAARRPGKLS